MEERIAIVSTSYPRTPGDAAGHFVATEAQALADAGNQVTIFCPGPAFEREGNPRLVRLADGGACGWPGLLARLRERPQRVFGLGRWMLATGRELERRAPFERIVAHWLLPTAYPLVERVPLQQARFEVVVHGSDARLLERLGRHAARHILGRLLRRGAHFRCVSHELASLLESCAGASLGSRVSVQLPPLDVSQAPSRDAARSKLGLAATTQLVVLVGRLVRGKRTREALLAAALVEGIQVVVLGDGPESDALRREFRGVLFLGRVERPLALCWLAAADALLCASRSEGAPSVVREARALGVPVVACAAGDLLQWAESDAGLWIVP